LFSVAPDSIENHDLIETHATTSGLIHSGDSLIARSSSCSLPRAGIVVNVTPEDRRRLEAIIGDRNADELAVMR
jgi:hypothetical protein